MKKRLKLLSLFLITFIMMSVFTACEEKSSSDMVKTENKREAKFKDEKKNIKNKEKSKSATDESKNEQNEELDEQIKEAVCGYLDAKIAFDEKTAREFIVPYSVAEKEIEKKSDEEIKQYFADVIDEEKIQEGCNAVMDLLAKTTTYELGNVEISENEAIVTVKLTKKDLKNAGNGIEENNLVEKIGFSEEEASSFIEKYICEHFEVETLDELGNVEITEEEVEIVSDQAAQAYLDSIGFDDKYIEVFVDAVEESAEVKEMVEVTLIKNGEKWLVEKSEKMIS